MENVILVIHLILAICLIGVVLLQRSEGGGLGMGGGGGGDGVMSGRQAATALAKLTWIFATLFIITSMTLTILAARQSQESSVIDQIGGTASAPAPAKAPAGPTSLPESKLPAAKDLLPPSPTGNNATDAPATPPRAD